MIAAVALLLLAADPPPAVRSLDGPWQFRRADAPADPWKPVTVPSAMQSHEGTDWHGVGVYRKAVGKLAVPAGQRVWVEFTAAATHAEVFWNGTRLGDHLGGWTPFRFDVTELVKAAPDRDHELTVKLDERVGHNTQGFLPIIQPHYGGLWQSVRLLTGVALPPDPPPARARTEVRGDQLFLDGKPLQVRGVLNWGYYPPTLEPNPSVEAWRADIRRLKERGFNLMKCCLWVPPARLLDVCDEEGMLVWMEYPTWHPKLTPDHLPALKQEFAEFFAHVRHHPCVVLHSLTCETGPSADLNVLKELTALCKRMIPGAVVEDDSSWIEWNRVTDFYDDHPYGNNHTWVKTLHRLRDYRKLGVKTLHRLRDYRKLGVKPLLLGEAIAADTWTPSAELLAKVGNERPYWLPHHLDANAAWLKTWADRGFPLDEKRLVEDSKRYAMLMRKYQIETFRREVPHGGYVVSVLRDFPLAAMGLVDYTGADKWPKGEWFWHGDTTLTLATPNDRRVFASGEDVTATVAVAGPLPAGVTTPRGNIHKKGPGGFILDTTEHSRGVIQGRFPSTREPVRLTAFATLMNADAVAESLNEWPLWLVPPPQPVPASVTVARHLDEKLLDQLEAGGRVLLLPDGQPGSPPLRSHWFLRGGPAVFDHPAQANVPRDLLVETQHFDLAGDVIPNLDYLDQIDPILLLWDNHDIKEVRTHALAFTTRVGKGRLLVSVLNHDGDTNAAGKYLLGEFGKHLATGPEPRKALAPATVAATRAKLREKKVELGGDRLWKFRPDPANDGLKQNWHRPDFDASKWADIRIDRHWEGQGYPTLDGWAWYRLTVDVPTAFAGERAYLRFTGVDDHYEVYVNGQLAGTGGDIASKTTAFDEVKSHEVTKFVTPGKPATVAVRVYDWYGAGGIFRPVTLTTAPDTPGATSIVR